MFSQKVDRKVLGTIEQLWIHPDHQEAGITGTAMLTSASDHANSDNMLMFSPLNVLTG